MNTSFNQLIQKHYINQEEKGFLKKIRHAMKSYPMKPLTAGLKADVKAFFKKHIGRRNIYQPVFTIRKFSGV